MKSETVGYAEGYALFICARNRIFAAKMIKYLYNH